ncbi:MAG: glycosyltransferase family 39 protein [Patescibacteria group bacterium]|jgi:hypothetical protein
MKKKVPFIVAAIFLLIQLTVQIVLAKNDSATTDEAVHLSAGYTYLVKNDFRFNPEHPVLVKTMVAAPLLALSPKIPNDSLYWNIAGNFFYDSWKENRAFGDDFLYGLGNNADLLIFLTRLPIMFLTLLLGISIFFISRKFWGDWAGVVSLGLFTFDPNFTAHGHLITTDIAISLGFLLSVYTFVNLLKNNKWLNIVMFAFALSFAFLVKYTSIILIPTLLILSLLYIYKQKIRLRKIVDFWPKLLVIIVIIWIMIISAYHFNFNLSPNTNSVSSAIKTSNLELTSLDKTPVLESNGPVDKIYGYSHYFLIPRDYFKGLFMVISHVEAGHSSYFLGMTSKTGWWYYFPVLLLLKTPILTLIILSLSLFLYLKSKNKNIYYSLFYLSAPLFLLMSMTSKANLGLRHIFPIYPILFVMAGNIFQELKSKKNILFIFFGILIIQFILVYPNYIAYYNQFVGGSGNGYKIAGDSNLDWGQDLKRIKKYIDEKNIKNYYVDYEWGGDLSLKYYGIINKELPVDLSKKQDFYLIVSSNTLMSKEQYQIISKNNPTSRITNSVFVYNLGEVKDE